MDARLHCVDLDTAYNQGAKKLDRALVVSKVIFSVNQVNSSILLVNQRTTKFSSRWCDTLQSFTGGTETEYG